MADEPTPVKKPGNRRLLWGIATIALGLFFIGDVLFPDCVPFVDEIVAGVLTVVSGYKTLQGYLKREKPQLPAPPER